jgi:hypothetical protein
MVDYNDVISQGYKAYDPSWIQKYFDMAGGNLNRQAATTGAYIGRQAGAHATNMVNPSSFILGHITQSQVPYAGARESLAAQSAQAQQQGAAGLANLLFQIRKAQSGDELARQQLDMMSPNFWTYLQGAGGLASNILKIPGVL